MRTPIGKQLSDTYALIILRSRSAIIPAILLIFSPESYNNPQQTGAKRRTTQGILWRVPRSSADSIGDFFIGTLETGGAALLAVFEKRA
jgi:hypothetical protein